MPHIMEMPKFKIKKGVSEEEFLIEYHGYSNVGQVILRPMPNDVNEFMEQWHGMSNTVDTVVILSHASPERFRLHSIRDSKGEYIHSEHRRIERRHIPRLIDENRSIATIVLLGCEMGMDSDNFARDLARQGAAERVIASHELIWMSTNGSHNRLTSTGQASRTMLDRLLGRGGQQIYPYSELGFRIFYGENISVTLGNEIMGVKELLTLADNLMGSILYDNWMFCPVE